MRDCSFDRDRAGRRWRERTGAIELRIRERARVSERDDAHERGQIHGPEGSLEAVVSEGLGLQFGNRLSSKKIHGGKCFAP